MNIQKISPKYDTSKLSDPTLEDYIDVYEDQIKSWYLNYAKQMHKDEHAGFAALQIAFSYFEGHAIFYKGEDSIGQSPHYFREAFLSVFPESEVGPAAGISVAARYLYHLYPLPSPGIVAFPSFPYLRYRHQVIPGVVLENSSEFGVYHVAQRWIPPASDHEKRSRVSAQVGHSPNSPSGCFRE